MEAKSLFNPDPALTTPNTLLTTADVATAEKTEARVAVPDAMEEMRRMGARKARRDQVMNIRPISSHQFSHQFRRKLVLFNSANSCEGRFD